MCEGQQEQNETGRYHKHYKVVKGKPQALENPGETALTNWSRVPGAKRALSECQALPGSPPNC